MKANFDSRHGDGCAHLGVQTNPDKVWEAAHRLAKTWKPGKAKSYRLALMHTDYNGRLSDDVTGYASIKVEYYTTVSEGTHSI